MPRVAKHMHTTWAAAAALNAAACTCATPESCCHPRTLGLDWPQVADALERELQQAREAMQQESYAAAAATGSVEANNARSALRESQRKVELLEAMVGALRERLKREEDRNVKLAGGLRAGAPVVQPCRSEQRLRDHSAACRRSALS